MKKPLISVILPNYNHARYLEERFKSIFNQTYQNYELIILDDNSLDNSPDIINKYKDNSHVSHIIFNDNNSGSPFKQWNNGFQLAKGDLIWIAESDDSCDNNFLVNLVDYYFKALKTGNISLVFCHSKMINCDGIVLPNTFQNSLVQSFVMEGKQFIKHYLIHSNIIQNASSVLFTKKSLDSIDYSYSNFKGAGDWLFWIEIARQGYVGYLNKELNFFRWHGNNTTIKKIKSGDNELEEKKIYDFMLDRNIISKTDYKCIKQRKLNKIYYSSAFNHDIRNQLLKEWGIDFPFLFSLAKIKVYDFLVSVFKKG